LTSDSAACALSFITSPSWPVSVSLPLPASARLDEQDVAADRRPREAGRHARDVGAHRDLGLELLRAQDRRELVAPICSRAPFSSAMRSATWRNTLPISRSRLRTPASRV
jgi:hypothetical protein